MARRHSRPRAATTLPLQTLARQYSSCGGPLRADYRSHHTIVTLDGLLGLDVQDRRCQSVGYKLFYVPLRAEAEGRLVLPQHEFSLEVIALVGALHHAEHRSVPEIHATPRVLKPLQRDKLPLDVRLAGAQLLGPLAPSAVVVLRQRRHGLDWKHRVGDGR